MEEVCAASAHVKFPVVISFTVIFSVEDTAMRKTSLARSLRQPFTPSNATVIEVTICAGHGLQLRSVGGGTVAILNGHGGGIPSVVATAVEPARQYVLRGFARTNGLGKLTFECQWLTFTGTPTVDPLARNSLPMDNASWIGYHSGTSVWEPLLLRLVSPGDAAFVRIGATAADGAVLDLFDVRLS